MEQRAQLLTDVMMRVDGVAPGSGLAKHRKMSISPFVMLRGASSQFYTDLSRGSVTLPKPMQQWPLTGIIGDCHISNFGIFSEEGSHGDHLIFAPNDFDDACIGHAGWDILRLAVSMILCVDHCQGMDQGTYLTDQPVDKKPVGNQQLQQALEQLLRSYHRCCTELLSGEKDYHSVLDRFEDDHILAKQMKKGHKRAASGEQFALKSSLAKAVDMQSSSLEFRNLPERFARLTEDQYTAIKHSFAPYVDDNIIDIVARLGAGTGSANMERFYLLVGPESSAMKNWPLFHIVEVKKQRVAAPLFEFANLSPVNLLNPAHLTVMCQRRMQRNPDLVLDDVYWKGGHWLVRSRHHAKVGIDPEDIALGKRARNGGFVQYAAACGEALALAHARCDRRSNQFEEVVIRDMPQVSEQLIEMAYKYSDQVIEDWQWLAGLESLT